MPTQNVKLLIEPMWNWNIYLHYWKRESAAELLIEPMWNWNRGERMPKLPRAESFNWTNVELKPTTDNCKQSEFGNF